MLRAGIDLGTNTFLLVVGEVEGGAVREVLEERLEFVRLGEGFAATGALQPAAIERALAALKVLKARCEAHKVPHEAIRLAGTSAIREASNGAAFLAQVKEETGFVVPAVSGEHEALLSWKGALSALQLPEGATPCLLDIGGGSSELIWDDGKEAYSLPIGAVKAKERFIHDDPPTQDQLAAINEAVWALMEALPSVPTPNPLIAVAGTATTLYAVAHEIEPYDSTRIHGQTLSVSALQALQERFCALTTPQRKTLKGLAPQRADIIPAGSQILLAITQKLQPSSLLISDRGLRFGLLLDD